MAKTTPDDSTTKAVPTAETRAAMEEADGLARTHRARFTTESGTPGEEDQGEPYADCFARACAHLVDKRCTLYTTVRPPIIVIDGRCMGFET